MKLLSTQEAAKRLKLSERWVRLMCQLRRLGSRVGGRWVISEHELHSFKRRPRGRPAKSKRSS